MTTPAGCVAESDHASGRGRNETTPLQPWSGAGGEREVPDPHPGLAGTDTR